MQFGLLGVFGLVLLFLLAPVLAVIPPLFIFQAKALKKPKTFELSAEETKDLARAEREIPRTKEALERCLQRGAGLNIKIDGTYDNRNRLGKELNQEWALLRPQLEHAEDLQERLRNAPLNRINSWVNVASGRDAFLGGFLLSLIALAHDLFFGFNLKYQPIIACGLGVSILVFYLIRKNNLQTQNRELIGRCEGFAHAFRDEPSVEFEYSGDESEDSVPEHPETSEWYTELGVSIDATEEEIKKAYKTKIAQNHPDKVAHMDEKFSKLAGEASRKLNWARDEGLRQVGKFD